ncbi:MAG: DUF4292 domain-containing protein [Bacteroidales bacterium]|jgi:hypothetical protein|nr:DUF4292 domain-containing protein [Bacteroidales bacterium]
MLLAAAGCSVKKAVLTAPATGSGNMEQVMASDVAELNYTARPFFIRRAEINIDGNNKSHKLIASVRFAKPDSFLVSIRILSGLEAARILLTGDTVLINDRINRTLYFGSNRNVKKKYGFDPVLFPLLFGDLLTGSTSLPAAADCNEGTATLREIRTDCIVNYFIDCKTGKCNNITVENEFMKEYISIAFGNFDKEGKMILPKQLKIAKVANFATVEIAIKNIEFDAASIIEFIPGRNYDRIEIK